MTDIVYNNEGQKHFEKLCEIYITTGRCFTYWSEKMTLSDRRDVMSYLELKEFMWAKVLNRVQEVCCNM